jgi:hypothetical protein
MPDEADIGNDLMLLQTELAIRESAARSSGLPPASKNCLFCGADLPAGGAGVQARWCDEDCRDDWEREQRALNRRAGGGPASSAGDRFVSRFDTD